MGEAWRRLRQLLLLAGLLAASVVVFTRVSSGWADRRVQLAVGIGGLRQLALRAGKHPAQVAAALRAAGVRGIWLPEETPARLAAQGRVSLLAGSRWRDLRRAAGAPWPAGLPLDPAYLLVGAHHPHLTRFVVSGLKVALGARTPISERLVGGTLAIGVGRSPAAIGALPLGFGPAGLALAHQARLTAIPVVQLPPAGMGTAGARSLFAGLATAAAPVHTLAVATASPGGTAASRRALRAMATVWRRSGWALAVTAGRPGAPIPPAVASLRQELGGSVGVYRVPVALLRARRPPVARIVAAVQERGAGWVYFDAAAVGSGGLASAVSWCHAVATALRAAGDRRLPPRPLPVGRPPVWLRLLGAGAVVAIGWSLVETLWPGRTSPWPWVGASAMLAAGVVVRPVLADGVAVLAVAGGAGLATACLAVRWQVAGSSFGRALVATAVSAGWSGVGLLLGMALAPAAVRGAWVAVILAAVVGVAASPRMRPGAGPAGVRAAAARALLAALVGSLLVWGAFSAVVGPWGRFAVLVAGWPLLMGALAGVGSRRETGVAWLAAVAVGQVVWARGFSGLPPGLALRREGFALVVGITVGVPLWVAVRARLVRGARPRTLADGSGHLTG